MAGRGLRAALRSPRKLIIGMVHVGATPGAPLHAGATTDQLAEGAIQEARIYEREGLDGVLIENMFDLPYSPPGELDTTCLVTMTAVADRVRRSLPRSTLMGIQLLAAANQEALAVAKITGLDFIRAEGFVFGHVADEGWINACAGPLLRYRKQVLAEDVLVMADVKKKHSAHAVTGDVSLSETIRAAEFFGADAVVLTGKETGRAVATWDLQEAAACATRLPLVLGSGVNLRNIGSLWSLGSAFIVGSDLKRNGDWRQPVEEERVRRFMRTVTCLRDRQ